MTPAEAKQIVTTARDWLALFMANQEPVTTVKAAAHSLTAVLREFNWPAAASGRPLHTIPTSELLAELNARKERSPVEVREIPGPSPSHPMRYGVCRDGDSYRKAGDHMLRQRYIAICDNPTEARMLATLINDTETARMRAAKE
jgi:hypothetical protein